MVQKGRTGSSLFRKLLKECEDRNHMEEYDTITEDGRIIKYSEQANEHMTN